MRVGRRGWDRERVRERDGGEGDIERDKHGRDCLVQSKMKTTLTEKTFW